MYKTFENPPCFKKTDLFFPDDEDDPIKTEPARRICRRCPFRMECLKSVMDTRTILGVWGGLTSNERRRVKRKLLRMDIQQAVTQIDNEHLEKIDVIRNDGKQTRLF